jgi:hypothetical protein
MPATLRLTITSGHNLVDKNYKQCIAPFCKLKLNDNTLTTCSKVGQGAYPVWNDTFVIQLDDVMRDVVTIIVYDSKQTNDDSLGYCTLQFNQMTRGTPMLLKQSLISAPYGEIQIEVTAIDFGVDPITSDRGTVSHDSVSDTKYPMLDMASFSNNNSARSHGRSRNCSTPSDMPFNW